jgi:hypothetical protein
MYIQLRRSLIASDQVAATIFAVEMAELVEQTTGHAVSVWGSVYGMPLGTVSWTTQVTGFADAAAQSQKLAENPEWLTRVSKAGEQGLFIPGSWEDGLARIVHAAGDAGPMMYASTTMGTPAPGMAMQALEWGTQMADHVASATGNQVILCTSNYGTATGSMIFFMGFDSAEGVDATQETLMSDSTYMEAMGKTAELFLPDGQRTLTQRLN